MTTTTMVRQKKIRKAQITTIIRVVEEKPLDAIPLSLFDDQDECWYESTLDVAMGIPSPFYGSELRRRCGLPPRHENMWGTLFRKLVSTKKFRRTGRYRRSPIGSRRGGVDFEYERL